MKLSFFLIFFLPMTGFSQAILDLGKINGNVISKCVDSIDGKICRSKNQLEIYLVDATVLAGKYNRVCLSYDGVKWSAIKYEGDWLHDKIDSFILQPVFSFDTIFTTLKANNIFILPDQKVLNLKNGVDDGNEYVLTFKAGDKFRKYEFNNPDLYMRFNPDVPELTNYVKIIDVLFNWLKKG